MPVTPYYAFNVAGAWLGWPSRPCGRAALQAAGGLVAAVALAMWLQRVVAG